VDKRLEQRGHNAKRLVRTLAPTLKGIEEAERMLAAHADKLSGRLPPDFGWSFLYELSFPLLQVVTLAAMGALEDLVAAAKGPDPLAAILGAIEKEMQDENPVVRKGATAALFSEEEVLALVIATFRSMKSLALYGAYMSELVQRIRDGSEKAFLDALRVDRTVITCPSVAEYAATWLGKADLLGCRRWWRTWTRRRSSRR
jgi:hypothetical protein